MAESEVPHWSGEDSGWHYLAQRFSGNGRGGIYLDTEVPLTNVSVTRALSAPWSIEAQVDGWYRQRKAPDGFPILYDWGTVVWAVKDDIIRGGGILVDSSNTEGKWTLNFQGFIDYPAGQPYTGPGYYAVEKDVFQVFRDTWAYIQAQPGANLGLEIDKKMSGIIVGVSKTQNEFDTVPGKQVFETDALKLAWHATPDLGAFLTQISEIADFDYIEDHVFDDADDGVRHTLTFGAPKLGRKREDLRFAIGENVSGIPTFEHNSEQYASTIQFLGAGEASKMKRGQADGDRAGRLRRAQVVTNSSLTSDAACARAAAAEVKWRINTELDVTQILVFDSPMARVATIDPGDTILLEGEYDEVDYEVWVRVLSITVEPANEDLATLEVVRANKLVR